MIPNIFSKQEDGKLDISWRAIFKLVVVFFSAYVIWIIKDILILFLFGLVISVLFSPAIDFLQRLRVARTLAVFLVYVAILGMLGSFVYLIAPVFIVEIEQFSVLFPIYFEKISPFLSGLGFEVFSNMEAFTEAARQWFVGSTSSIVSSIAGIFGNILISITVFTIALFISLEESAVEKLVKVVSPKRYEEFYLDVWSRTKVKISGWFAAKAIMMALVGVATSITCFVLGIKYPIIFGVFAGILDIIPFIGPVFAGFIIGLFTLIYSWETALLFIAVFILIQQIESNILTPILAKRFTELPPILVLGSLLVGERLMGLAGAILAIPLFGIFFDLARLYLEKNKDR
ncbi:MAG TPA: AI-2E family transporter [Candidatus Paceibacterota bacterium]|nr:AI-2E family transporter [Candidatus Pacearchaeota archaeon]HRZ51339.1 AI-2E family transporter [Candidatus Paceibacterota bacterium]HSA37061.1 AI-2E family transporter [Candidatus Paceibacterota bacterium]